MWDWQLLVTLACLAWRMQARAERGMPGAGVTPARLAVLEAGEPPHASTPLFDVPTTADMETVVIAAGHRLMTWSPPSPALAPPTWSAMRP